MPTHHEIKINLTDGRVRPDPTDTLEVGDTVRYSSPDGKARVAFLGKSPYEVSEVGDSETHTLCQGGHYTFNCFVTPTGSKNEVGWGPGDPDAGGVHDVIPT